MTTVLRVNFNELSTRFFQELGKKFDQTSKVEIRISEKTQKPALLSDAQFWQVIDCLDWSKDNSKDISAPAAQKLAAMPVENIYLFATLHDDFIFQIYFKKH